MWHCQGNPTLCWPLGPPVYGGEEPRPLQACVIFGFGIQMTFERVCYMHIPQFGRSCYMGSKMSRLTSWPLFTREIKLNISLPTSRESSVIKDSIWIVLSYHARKFQIVRWLFRFYIHYRIAVGVSWCLVGLGRGWPDYAVPSCSPLTIEPS